MEVIINLFICHTPLQAKIASRIISEEKIKSYDLFYFTHSKNVTQSNYYHSLSKESTESIFYTCEFSFPSYFFALKKMFKNKKYDCVYLASIDNIYAHIILSYIKFNRLNTFDDGGANLSNTSLYYVSERNFFASLTYYLMGSRYTLNKVKKISQKHFSIYFGKSNIIDNVQYISLYDPASFIRNEDNLKESCNVFLGSYYEYVSVNRAKLLAGLSAFFENKTNVFYIQHPMEMDDFSHGMERLESGKIAEDLIIELGSKYKIVNVFGIASSALFNLNSIEWINGYTIISSLLTDDCNNLSAHFIKDGGSAVYLD